jgi:hypothetical protein
MIKVAMRSWHINEKVESYQIWELKSNIAEAITNIRMG